MMSTAFANGQQKGKRKHQHAALMFAMFFCAVTFAVAAGAAVPLAHVAGGGSSTQHAQGYLGIEFHDATEEEVAAAHLHGAHGVEVVMVDHDGPAGEAGLQPHDVVLQMDGKDIPHADDLRKRIHDSEPGKLITLTVLRLGHMLTVSAKLANREELERKEWLEHMTVPAPSPAVDATEAVVVEQYNTEEPPEENSSPRSAVHGQSFLGSVLRIAPYTGLELQTMEPQLAGFFGAPPHTGLLVHGVEQNSPAASAGLRAGDVVLKVNSAKVKSTSDWTKQVRAGKDRALNLTILRDKHEQTVLLTPDAKKHSAVEFPELPVGCAAQHSAYA